MLHPEYQTSTIFKVVLLHGARDPAGCNGEGNGRLKIRIYTNTEVGSSLLSQKPFIVQRDKTITEAVPEQIKFGIYAVFGLLWKILLCRNSYRQDAEEGGCEEIPHHIKGISRYLVFSQ